MGIDYRLAKAILQEHKYSPIKGTIILVGQQTIVLTKEEAIALIKENELPVRPEAFIEVDSTTYGSEGRSLITARSFFSLFTNAEVLALDVNDYENAEIIHDLNKPLPENLKGIADFIFNGSCMDNLFDPASALKNISHLLRPGGRVLHIEHGSPIQGAYLMYSPAYFFEYYAVNEFVDCKVYACMFENVLDPWNVFLWEPYFRKNGKWILSGFMHNAWANILNFVIAEKGPASTAEKTPIQGFYREVHGTNEDLYFKAFETYRSISKRPIMQMPKIPDDGSKRYMTIDGFFYVGTLEDPMMKLQANSLAQIDIARSERSAGNFQEAVEAFTRALNISSSVGYPGLVWVERGDMYHALKQFDKALEDYEKAIDINPHQTYLQRKLDMLLHFEDHIGAQAVRKLMSQLADKDR